MRLPQEQEDQDVDGSSWNGWYQGRNQLGDGDVWGVWFWRVGHDGDGLILNPIPIQIPGSEMGEKKQERKKVCWCQVRVVLLLLGEVEVSM